MKPVVFTLEVCPNCERLKEKLTEAGIEYEERDMQDKMSLVDLRVLGCFAREAPVLLIGRRAYEFKEILSEDGDIEPGILAALRS